MLVKEERGGTVAGGHKIVAPLEVNLDGEGKEARTETL